MSSTQTAVIKTWQADGSGGRKSLAWLADQHDALKESLVSEGAVLIRGLALSDPADIDAVARVLMGPRSEPREPFAARPRISATAHGSPQWPGDREMCPHNEQAYASRFPRTLLLGNPSSEQPQGRTLLADGALIRERLDAQLLARFEESGWALVRNFRTYIGMAWTEAFGTTEPAVVSDYCQASDIRHEWRGDGSLRTWQVRPAVITHPDSGAVTWFNQIAFLSQWSLRDSERDVLLSAYGPEGLPFNTFFGDGTPIAREELAHLQEVIDGVTVEVEWGQGDVLLLDNLRTAHGRTAYEGEWPLWEVQGDPLDWHQAINHDR